MKRLEQLLERVSSDQAAEIGHRLPTGLEGIVGPIHEIGKAKYEFCRFARTLGYSNKEALELIKLTKTR